MSDLTIDGVNSASQLPTGTLTFLFTDIEGSTRRWEQHPIAMRLAVATHDGILRQAIESNGGVVFKTGGDAFYAVFVSATDAVRAAFVAQKAIESMQWGEVGPLRVRIALHTGIAELRGGDYFGAALNRVSRLLSSGSGGQVLLTGATESLIQDLPFGASLKDMGKHKLRDLSGPLHVFQLLHAELAADFPALKSLDSIPNNLPVQVTSFVGREHELTQAKSLLAKSRVLTLTGPGGSGKSRLSIHAAATLLEQFPDGVWFVELAPLVQPELVPLTVAVVLGVHPQPSQPIVSTLVGVLGDKTSLVILDNCEHLVDACARLADTLIRSCPNLSILASSRETFQIAGETILDVPPLASADPEHLPPLDQLGQYEAVQLFVDRACSVRATFALTPENALSVAQICYRLDGIPLAIELAAARVRALSPEQIATRLDDRFKLLTSGSRTALPRQQTLRALVDWSYDWLNESEKSLLRRLSIFVGGWTLEAAEAVCGDNDLRAISDVLVSLADKSLVVVNTELVCPRYGLLETIRSYALERLEEAGERSQIARRHADYYSSFALQNDASVGCIHLQTGLRALLPELGNFRGVLHWAVAQKNDPALGATLIGAIWWFFVTKSLTAEFIDWCERVLEALGSEAEQKGEAMARLALAAMETFPPHRRLRRAISAERPLGNAQGAVELLRATGDCERLAIALCMKAFNLAFIGQTSEAESSASEALAIAQGNGLQAILPLARLAKALSMDPAQLTERRQLLVENVELFKSLPYAIGLGANFIALGAVEFELGNHARALEIALESEEMQAKVGLVASLAEAKLHIAASALALDRVDLAEQAALGALAIAQQREDPAIAAAAIQHLAGVITARGEARLAARLLGASESLRGNLYTRRPAEQYGYEITLKKLRKAIPIDLEAVIAEGRCWSMADAITNALNAIQPEGRSERAFGSHISEAGNERGITL